MIKSLAITIISASMLLHSAAVAEQAPLRIGLLYLCVPKTLSELMT